MSRVKLSEKVLQFSRRLFGNPFRPPKFKWSDNTQSLPSDVVGGYFSEHGRNIGYEVGIPCVFRLSLNEFDRLTTSSFPSFVLSFSLASSMFQENQERK